MPVSALHTDQFHFQISSLFTVLQFPFERSANLDVIFSFMGSSHGWLHWQDTNMKTSSIRHIASFHDKLLQSSWVPGGYSKWGHGYISIFMFLCSISCIWCIPSICVFKLLLHFPSLKWTDDQREQQEVISSENISGAEVPWEISEKLFTKDKFLRKAPLKEFLAKLDVIVFEIIDF